MKTLAYYLLGIFSLCILNACDNEENPTPNLLLPKEKRPCRKS